MLEEYYNLDCEDVIGGGKLKTRFKYTNVPEDDFGLTPEEILLLEDKHLNKIVSLKQLRPYRNMDENGNVIEDDKQKKKRKATEFKVKKLRAELREELEAKKVSHSMQLSYNLETGQRERAGPPLDGEGETSGNEGKLAKS